MGYYGLKLAKLRRVPVAVVRQARIFKQHKRLWQQKQKETLGLMDDLVGGTRGSSLGKRFEHVHRRYGYQVMAVKQLKMFYGNLKENQLRSVVEHTGHSYRTRVRKRTSTVGRRNLVERRLRIKSSLVGVLERRLQTVLWRRMLCRRMDRRRQVIAHGKVKVNGKTIRSCRYGLKAGDRVQLVGYRGLVDDADRGRVQEVKASLGRVSLWKQLPFRCPPAHLEVSLQKGLVVYGYTPLAEEVMFPFKLDLGAVRNFYGRG